MRSTAVIIASLALAGCYNEALPLRDLAARHQITTGQVISRDCANHGAVYYKFVVDGRTQAGRAPMNLLDCTKARVGDPVKIYYDPANPTVYTFKEPQLVYEERRGFYIPIWLAVPLVFMLMFAGTVFNAKSSRDGRPAAEVSKGEGATSGND